MLPRPVGLPAGTYTGAGNINVLFNSRPITVQGIGGAAVTLFDTQGVGPAFQFVGTESSTSVLKGWRATCLRLLRPVPPVELAQRGCVSGCMLLHRRGHL